MRLRPGRLAQTHQLLFSLLMVLLLGDATSPGSGLWVVLAQQEGEDNSSSNKNNTSSTVNTGSPECPCIDSVFPLTTLYPEDFGASFCAQHDIIAQDPLCMSETPPDYCAEQWCYIDIQKCKRSSEGYFQSDSAPSSGLYYSYSTCNSTVDPWKAHLTTSKLQDEFIGVVIPGFWAPAHYKLTESGEIAEWDSEAEYYNDTVPWRGWIIDYLEALAESTDIAGFNYTFRSGGSDVVSPSSAWTAAVHDVSAGIANISVSSFWITSSRLELTTFTTSASLDKIYLWIPEPSVQDDFASNVQKVLLPFTPALWGCIAASIAFVSFLSIWLATKDSSLRKWWHAFRSDSWLQGSMLKRSQIIFKLGIDAFMATATFFFGHTVHYDIYSSLASKILIFGYGFLILIAVAAYTANLAAYLATSGVGDYIQSIEEAILFGVTICAHPVLEVELGAVWPSAKFIYNTDHEDLYLGMLEWYDAGYCDVVVTGTSDILSSESIQAEFCSRSLVYTSSLVLEKATAFPVSRDLAAGFSHYMYEAEQKGIRYSDFEEASRPPEVCTLQLSNTLGEDLETPSLSVANFALPFTVMLSCALIAILVHLYTMKTSTKYLEQHRPKSSRLSRLSSIVMFGKDLDVGTADGDENEQPIPDTPDEDLELVQEDSRSVHNTDHVQVDSVGISETAPLSPPRHQRNKNGRLTTINSTGQISTANSNLTRHLSSAEEGGRPQANSNDINKLIALMRESESCGDFQTKMEALVSLQEYQFNLMAEIRTMKKQKKMD